MSQFPRTEPEIEGLARLLIGGLQRNTDRFPAPPVEIGQLETLLDEYLSARSKAIEASALARLATRDKKAALKRLVGGMKTNIRYAENTCGQDHATLKSLGWGGRRPKRSMEVPGEVEGLKILEEGPGWIELKWRKPRGGGEVKAYRIERCRLGGKKWSIAGMATGTNVRLEDQDRGVHLMYRVIAVNAVGEGMYSPTAEAVL